MPVHLTHGGDGITILRIYRMKMGRVQEVDYGYILQNNQILRNFAIDTVMAEIILTV